MKFTSVLKMLSLVFVMALVSCGDEDVDAREKFLGSWEGTLSGCSIDLGMPAPYDIPDLPMDMTFANSTTENVIDITVESLFFTTQNTTATVDGNVITIAPFVVELAAGPSTIAMTMSGPGTYKNETTIDVDVKVEALGAESNCALELLKS